MGISGWSIDSTLGVDSHFSQWRHSWFGFNTHFSILLLHLTAWKLRELRIQCWEMCNTHWTQCACADPVSGPLHSHTGDCDPVQCGGPSADCTCTGGPSVDTTNGGRLRWISAILSCRQFCCKSFREQVLSHFSFTFQKEWNIASQEKMVSGWETAENLWVVTHFLCCHSFSLFHSFSLLSKILFIVKRFLCCNIFHFSNDDAMLNCFDTFDADKWVNELSPLTFWQPPQLFDNPHNFFDFLTIFFESTYRI